jgi:CheY-like chemotaxis protein
LVTNAIKFIKPRPDSNISIRFGARLSEPRSFFQEDTFWATRSNHTSDITSNPEWGTGEVVYLTFIVKDNGIGMTNNEIHKIFERFRQANMRTHVKYGGSGLGLFISKELTEKQGGEIGVYSTGPGDGSTFGFYVKTRRVDRRPQKLGKILAEKNGIAPQQLHVLLVEDNIINQQVLGKQLKKAGCIVEVANHGVEALDALEKQVYDIVLMDLEMPVMDGLTAMQEIRKREKAASTPTMPIIAVTANVRQEQIDSALAAGAVSPLTSVNSRQWLISLGSRHAKTFQSCRPRTNDERFVALGSNSHE